VEILFQDDHLVAVAKPSGLMAHPSPLDRGADNCVDRLETRLGRRAFPIHRLDRGTSGVLLFALDRETASRMGAMVRERALGKRYLTVVRGYLAATGEIDRPVDEAPSRTLYAKLAEVELPFAVSRYPTTRYSLAEVRTETGRRHQIRRHMAAIRHPIVGDTWYGEGKHNQFFREHFGVRRMLLHASELAFDHPADGREVIVRAKPDAELATLLGRLGWLAAAEGAS